MVEFVGVCYGKGLITVIDQFGEVRTFLQEGIVGRSRLVNKALVEEGILASDWGKYEEIPLGVKVITEDELASGKIYVKYSTKRERDRVNS